MTSREFNHRSHLNLQNGKAGRHTQRVHLQTGHSNENINISLKLIDDCFCLWMDTSFAVGSPAPSRPQAAARRMQQKITSRWPPSSKWGYHIRCTYSYKRYELSERYVWFVQWNCWYTLLHADALQPQNTWKQISGILNYGINSHLIYNNVQ